MTSAAGTSQTEAKTKERIRRNAHSALYWSILSFIQPASRPSFQEKLRYAVRYFLTDAASAIIFSASIFVKAPI